MADASKRIGRLRRIDRLAVVVISLGGIGVVVAVLGILVFIAGEAVPLFRSARLTPQGQVRVPTALTPAAASALRAVGADEYQKYLYTVEPSGVVAFYRLETGERVLGAPGTVARKGGRGFGVENGGGPSRGRGSQRRTCCADAGALRAGL